MPGGEGLAAHQFVLRVEDLDVEGHGSGFGQAGVEEVGDGGPGRSLNLLIDAPDIGKTCLLLKKKFSMATATTAGSKQKQNGFPENIFVVSSSDASVPPGKEYKVLKRKDKWFIFNKNGQRIPLDEKTLRWVARDKVVMIVKVTSAVLGSIEPGQVYRVYDDAKNDERYILDGNNEKVLFDKNIFKWEVL